MRFLAKPKILNSKFDKTFKTEKEAVAFLEKETELSSNKLSLEEKTQLLT